MDKFILAYDGDGCGKKVGRAIMANDEAELSQISARIDLGHEIVNHWAKSKGGSVISGGGDEGTFQVPAEALHEVELLRKDYEFATGITISVGIGRNLSEAGRALLAAKFRGKNQIAHYDDSVEKDINKARKRVKKGRATQEEYKLAEAYLEKADNMDQTGLDDCQYCNQTDGTDLDHCKYCHDMESQVGEAHCQYCAEADARNNAHTDNCQYCMTADQRAHGHTGDDCQYCADAAPADAVPEGMNGSSALGPTIKNPTTTSSTDFAGQGLNPPEIDVGSTAASQLQGQPAVPQGTQAEAQATIAPQEEDTHSKAALQAIAQQIEGSAPQTQTPADMASQVDDTDLAVGTNMEGNTSRPAGFEQNVPGDMGLAEDPAGEPDLADVLKEGLDSHADNIQRDRVVQMAAAALQGFKGCKEVLERAKEQAPQLYQSSIAMLKAMIEMAKLLGLGQGEADPSVGPPTENNEWHQPFPAHPDHGGQQMPGHEAPKEGASPPQL